MVDAGPMQSNARETLAWVDRSRVEAEYARIDSTGAVPFDGYKGKVVIVGEEATKRVGIWG